MTDQEKSDNKDAYTCDGYLKTTDYLEAWKQSWIKNSEVDRAKVFELPNYNSELFFEISGIDLRKISKSKVLKGYCPFKK